MVDLPRQLKRRATGDPEAPWLFFRRDLDWHWRSYRRVADQVGRTIQTSPDGAVVLNGAVQDDAAVPCPAWQDPDTPAALIAVLAAGRSPGFSLSLETPPWLAVCRGALESFDAVSFEVPAGPPVDAAGMRFSLGLSRDTEHLASSLRPALRDLPERPILYAGAAVTPSQLAALTAWSLEHHAPWALEAQADAFAATALWTRPHVLLGTRGELGELIGHFAKSERRRSRLRAVLVTGPEPATDDAADVLGCPVMHWPPPGRPASP